MKVFLLKKDNIDNDLLSEHIHTKNYVYRKSEYKKINLYFFCLFFVFKSDIDRKLDKFLQIDTISTLKKMFKYKMNKYDEL